MKGTIEIGLILVVGSVANSLRAEENWPHWRGPQGTGVAADGEYPVKFTGDEGLAWKAELPGVGSSTPAVWGDQIFVSCGIDGQDGLLCFGMDGQERWRKQFGAERTGKHRNGSGSNPSPATNGKHVVAYYKTGTLVCLDLGGNEIWRTNLQERFGKDTLWWDLGTSPVLAGERVVVAVMHEGESFLVAFNLADGDIAWRQPREYENARESDQSYTTPQLVKIDGADVIVTWGADHLTGHDAATGKLLWECGGFNPQNKAMWRVIASAAIDNGIAVVPFGRGDFLAGVRLGGTGDVTDTNHVWLKEKLGADVPTPVIADGRAYLLTDAGRIVCLDVKTGDEHWSANLPKNRNKFYSSPVLAGDKFYCTREDGTVFVGRVSDTGFELLSSNEMGEQLIATPVPIRGKVLIRGAEHLYCVGPASTHQTQRGG